MHAMQLSGVKQQISEQFFGMRKMNSSLFQNVVSLFFKAIDEIFRIIISIGQKQV